MDGSVTVFVPSSRWQRAVIAAILIIPLVVVVLLSAPAWILWPFLDAERRTAVLGFLDRLIEWIKVLAGIS